MSQLTPMARYFLGNMFYMSQVKKWLCDEMIQVGDSFNIAIESIKIDESEMTLAEYNRNVNPKTETTITTVKEKEVIKEWKSWN